MFVHVYVAHSTKTLRASQNLLLFGRLHHKNQPPREHSAPGRLKPFQMVNEFLPSRSCYDEG